MILVLANIVYALAGLTVAFFAVAWMVAKELEPPDWTTGAGMALIAVILGALWPVTVVFGLLALIGRTLGRVLWNRAHPPEDVLPES